MKNIIDYNPNFSVRVINGVAKLFISDNGKEKQFKPVNPEPPVPPVPPEPTNRILYTVVEGGTQPTSTWITTNCSDNVFDAETGEGYLVLNEGVTTIDCSSLVDNPNMFDDSGEDSNITTVVIPTQITTVGVNSFHGITCLTSVTIPNSVTSIGESAFTDCTGLTSITIPDSVTNIGNAVFCGCSGLISVMIPNSVTRINNQMFYKCTRLTSIIIPDSVTSIGHSVFWNCSSLTSVTIPDSVISMGNGAFRGCSSLASVTCFATTPPILGTNVFFGINTTTCAVPERTVAAYKASDWKNYFTTFTEIQ